MAICAERGCPVVVPNGRCQKHEKQRSVEQEQRRIPSHPLLHTNRWRETSKRNLALHPWCVGYPGGVHGNQRVLAQCTDHIKPVKDYPELCFDPSNHQSICHDCNRRKGIAEEGGFGR